MHALQCLDNDNFVILVLAPIGPLVQLIWNCSTFPQSLNATISLGSFFECVRQIAIILQYSSYSPSQLISLLVVMFDTLRLSSRMENVESIPTPTILQERSVVDSC